MQHQSKLDHAIPVIHTSGIKHVLCACNAGKEWSMDSDYGTAPAETGAAYLAMLSIDSLLNVVAALEKLTDLAVDGVVVTPDASAGTLSHFHFYTEIVAIVVFTC